MFVSRTFVVVVMALAVTAGCGEKGITNPDPGDSAQLAFTRFVNNNWEIFLIRADGTGQANLTNHGANDVNPSWSPDGSKLAFASDRDGAYSIYMMNADGTGVTRLTTPPSPRIDGLPSWSSDGSRIAFTRFDRVDGDTRIGGDIFILNVPNSTLTNLTNTTAVAELNPTWSADGASVIYESYGAGPRDIFRVPVGGGEPVNLTNNSADDFKPAASRVAPGQIAFTSNRQGTSIWNIFIMNPDGTQLRRLTQTSGQDSNAAWSKDGSRIAFSRRSGAGANWDLHIVNADGTGERRLSTVAGEPTWRP